MAFLAEFDSPLAIIFSEIDVLDAARTGSAKLGTHFTAGTVFC